MPLPLPVLSPHVAFLPPNLIAHVLTPTLFGSFGVAVFGIGIFGFTAGPTIPTIDDLQIAP